MVFLCACSKIRDLLYIYICIHPSIYLSIYIYTHIKREVSLYWAAWAASNWGWWLHHPSLFVGDGSVTGIGWASAKSRSRTYFGHGALVATWEKSVLFLVVWGAFFSSKSSRMKPEAAKVFQKVHISRNRPRGARHLIVESRWGLGLGLTLFSAKLFGFTLIHRSFLFLNNSSCLSVTSWCLLRA